MIFKPDPVIIVAAEMARRLMRAYEDMAVGCVLCGDLRGRLDLIVLCEDHDAAFNVIPVYRRDDYGVPCDLIGYVVERRSP